MKEITVIKKLKVFSICDVREASQYINEYGYFANSEDEFQSTSHLFTLDSIHIEDSEDEKIFNCIDGSYSLFAIVEC